MLNVEAAMPGIVAHDYTRDPIAEQHFLPRLERGGTVNCVLSNPRPRGRYLCDRYFCDD